MIDVKLNSGLQKILNKPYPFDVVEENKRKAIEKYGEDYIIDFGVGDPIDPVPEIIRNTVKKYVDVRATAGYPVSTGNKEYLNAVSKYLKNRFNTDIDTNNICVTHSSKNAVFNIVRLFIEPNNSEYVICPNPGYPPYSIGTILAGGIPYFVNLTEENNYRMNLKAIPKNIIEKTKIIFVNSPNNPTGVAYDREELKEIVDFCIEHNILLISDEAYIDNYYSDKSPASILEIEGNEKCSIAIHSFSKRSRMTSYVVGFIVSKTAEFVQPFKVMMAKSSQGVNQFILDAAITALEDTEHIKNMNNDYSNRMDIMIPVLQELGFEINKPVSTLYLWCKITDGRDPIEVAKWFLFEYGLNVTPGNIISETVDGVNPGDNYVRLAMVPSTEKTIEAADRLRK